MIDGMLSVHAKRAVFTAMTGVPGIVSAEVEMGEAIVEGTALDEAELRGAAIYSVQDADGIDAVMTRVPLINRAPWLPGSVGRRTSALSELSDQFPTMAELAGVPLPPGEALDGASLVPAMRGGAGHMELARPRGQKARNHLQ
jgi:hypothetical protein